MGLTLGSDWEPSLAARCRCKRVRLLEPVKYLNQSLMNVASFYLRFRPGHLAKSQFPATIELADGLSALPLILTVSDAVSGERQQPGSRRTQGHRRLALALP
jgi:hypothetical protein